MVHEDIIDLPRPVSNRRRHMPMINRAAQFSPFAALTGYDEAVTETARLTDRRCERDELTEALLNERMQILAGWEYKYPEITVEYFIPDERKSGGAYTSVTGAFRRLNYAEQAIELDGGTKIAFENIYFLCSEIFPGGIS